MAAPSRLTVLTLYKQLLKESKLLTDYNFREYAIRRTRDAFREYKGVSDSAQIQALISKAEENLGVLKRQAMLGQAFRSKKLVLES